MPAWIHVRPSSYSHPYSFFLLAAFLELTEHWYDQPRTDVSTLLGIVSGLIVLARHTNVLFLLFFPLYNITGLSSLRARLAHFTRERRMVAVMAIVAAIVVSPQLAIYYQATGRIFVSSYGDLGFNFASPRVVQVLFSVQKGLFFWSPVLLVSCAGLLWLARSRHSTTSGMRGWEEVAGRRFRWMGSHSSLFVPSDARLIEIPVRTTFDEPGDWPITVSISIDDRPGDQLVLADAEWHAIVLRMPPPGSRRVRRIDIRLDRTRDDNRGAAIGEIAIR